VTVTRPADKPINVERFNDAGDGNHHGWLGFTVTEIDTGLVVAERTVRGDQLNPGAGLHGGVSASFADSLSGYGTFTCLPTMPRASPPSASTPTTSAKPPSTTP